MAERMRILWNGEKKKYQPRIKADKIHDLYKLKEKTNVPMTVLVDEALDEYIDRRIDELLEDDAEDLSAYLYPYRND